MCVQQEVLEQLIPTYTTLRSELNEAEQTGILKANDWAFSRSRHTATILTEAFLTNLPSLSPLAK